MMKLISSCKWWLIAALIVALYGVVGNMDYKDETQYQAYACHMVKDGYWPKDHCKE